MSQYMSVTEFLRKLPCDIVEFVRFIEDESYDRLLKLVHIKDNEGMTDEKMDLLQIEYRYELRNKISEIYPQFNALHIEGAIQLVYDCIQSDEYLDSIFMSLNLVLTEASGKVLWTNAIGLPVKGVQFN